MLDQAINEMTPKEVLARVPQQAPFRFIDEILSIDDDSITATYTWRKDADFYKGHFPGNPITPGVLLLESTAQAGVVAFGIYLAAKTLAPEELKEITTLFTESQVEFLGVVKPGQKIIIRAKKLYFRRLKLKVEFETSLEDGRVVCRGTMAGLGVKTS
ncbi:MAG TPA: beta-hydroxyacyl-ACP dehydratase [Gammaproteobacteria bacterium]|nr:beta-hydroxyacyl-ACP dehydratase [Gammaproteobacteria bacterium]